MSQMTKRFEIRMGCAEIVTVPPPPKDAPFEAQEAYADGGDQEAILITNSEYVLLINKIEYLGLPQERIMEILAPRIKAMVHGFERELQQALFQYLRNR